MKYWTEKYWIFIYTLVALPLGNYLTFLSARSNLISYESLSFYMLSSISASLVMLAIPLFIIKFHSESTSDNYGLRAPEKLFLATKITIGVIFLSTLVLYLYSLNPSFKEYYTIKHKIDLWFFAEICISFFYFFSEEFYFRGFLLYKLIEKFESKYSIIISNILFALLHLGKPAIEVIFAFFYGILLSTITIKTRSIFPAVIIHFAIALILNLMILYI